MSLIGSDMQTDYEKLGQALAIPQSTIKTIKANRCQQDIWHFLNDVIWQWLSWNYDDRLRETYKVKPNKKWLLDAVKAIDKQAGERLLSKIGNGAPPGDGQQYSKAEQVSDHSHGKENDVYSKTSLVYQEPYQASQNN